MKISEAPYHPSAEQVALASTIDESLRELLPLSRLHGTSHEDDATWESLEEIGVFAISLSEELGGSGLGAIEEALIAMALGRRLASTGVLATIGAAHLRQYGGGSESGALRVTAAYRDHGRIIIVDEPGASVVLLRDTASATLHRVPAGHYGRVVDDRLWLATLRHACDVGEPLARCDEPGLGRLRLIDAAALAGIAEATLEMAVAYAGVRQQFGRPIGSFQAIKHHCANMAIGARCARDQVCFAAAALDEGRVDAQLQIECALFVAGSAALENASKNIQIHGGIGFSDGGDPHLFLKRAQLLAALAGGLEAAGSRIAAIEGPS